MGAGGSVVRSEETDNETRRSGHRRDEEARLAWAFCRAGLEASNISLAAQDLDGRFIWVLNPPLGVGGEGVIGKIDSDILPGEAAGQVAEARRAVLNGGLEKDFVVEIADDGLGSRWYEVMIRARREELSGDVIGTVATAIDVTERKVQEEHLRIVLRELAHRSKNLLAVIQGIARQTADSAHTTDEFVSRFNGRIFSLSRAHDVLTDADWRGARLFDLVRSQVALYASDRLDSVVLEGEDRFLRPNAAQYIGLALHELTTNAIKYGALSVQGGEVHVRFERSAAGPGLFRLTWSEHQGPAVREPKRGRSFGLMMLCQVVPAAVDGAARMTFDADGLSYELDVSTAELLP